MKKISLEEAEIMALNMPYFKSIWDDNATSNYIHKTYDLRCRIEHAEFVSGISNLKQNLRKVDTLLRFYDFNKMEHKKEYPKELIEDAKEQAKYLKSKKEYLLEELANLNKQVYIELEY